MHYFSHLTQIEQLQMFDPESSKKLPDASTAGLRVAFERANLYFTKSELFIDSLKYTVS